MSCRPACFLGYLSRENTDGTFSQFDPDGWTLAEGEKTLKQTELYPLAVKLEAGETDISVVLAAAE